jgi:hypothetical protein
MDVLLFPIGSMMNDTTTAGHQAARVLLPTAYCLLPTDFYV